MKWIHLFDFIMFVLKIIILGGVGIFISGCFYFTSPMRKAEKALEKGDCKQAQNFFLSAQNKKWKFAKKAAELCLSKFPAEAGWFYYYLSEREVDIEKRLLFKEKQAKIYFEKLKNYEKAIELYSFLRSLNLSGTKRQSYSFHIALSYFEMGKWEASLKEILLLTTDVKKVGIFENPSFHKAVSPPAGKGVIPFAENIAFLKARVFLMQEKYKEAEQIFRKIQQTNPVYFKKNKIFLYLSFIYESQKDFHQAISELETFQSTSEFLVDKIKRLKIRQSNQPGSAYF